MRVQKLISERGLASRRTAEEWIKAGRVTVNGQPVTLGMSVEETDTVCVDGKPLPKKPKLRYLLLNKPRGYVTTLSDEKGRRTVADLVASCGERVYPVGRLDCDSEGLLLMTNDGALAQRLMHPSHEIGKTYQVWVEGATDAGLQRLREPMQLDGYALRPAEITVLRCTQERAVLRMTIHEGRNRQIRRMCEFAGMRVTRLRRIAEGPLRLGNLPVGQWRELTVEERAKLGEKPADRDLQNEWK